MFNQSNLFTLTVLLFLTHTTHSWTLDNVKDTRKRSLSLDLKGHVPDDSSESLQDWLAQEIELQRRADEELQAAEIAAAKEEYERIKYNIELERRGYKSVEETKRAGGEDMHRADDLENLELKRRGYKSVEKTKRAGGEDIHRADDLENLERRRRNEESPTKVIMGVPDAFCDDANRLLATDWDPADPANVKDYTCNSSILQPDHQSFDTKCVHPRKPSHICMREKLQKQTEPPVLGNHRPLWAKYGKYKYLPWQRWVHNLEHGAIGFLYHKCADPEQVKDFENVLVNCIRKHVITPYELPPEKPFALVSWGCSLYLTHFDKQVVFDFIKTHALHGRENLLTYDGQYDKMLVTPAKIASDYEDSDICPKSRFPEMYNSSLSKSDKDIDQHFNMIQKLTRDRQQRAGETTQKERQRKKREADWSTLTNGRVIPELKRADWSDSVRENFGPELEREAEIAKLEEEEGMGDVRRETRIAQLEQEEDIARLERQADIAHLQRDLDTVKKLFHQKVKPLMRI